MMILIKREITAPVKYCVGQCFMYSLCKDLVLQHQSTAVVAQHETWILTPWA